MVRDSIKTQEKLIEQFENSNSKEENKKEDYNSEGDSDSDVRSKKADENLCKKRKDEESKSFKQLPKSKRKLEASLEKDGDKDSERKYIELQEKCND
jgi:hypothetical protein